MAELSKYEILISTEQVEAHRNDPNWVIVDCRFDLSKPDWGFNDYQQGHISGAVYAHLDHDLAGPLSPTSGRHPLPEQQTFRDTLTRLGISNTSQVIVYDTAGGAYAARLWWLLKYHGHRSVAVLDGGYAKWVAESHPTSAGIEANPPGVFTSEIQLEMVVSTAEVEALINDPAVCIIDARAPFRFRGEQEPIDPIAGHIPSALNRFHANNLASSGSFTSPAELKSQFEVLLNGLPSSQAVVYCGSGVTSCHHIVAMASAGLALPRLYPGSWSEWIRSPSRPIATGD